MLLLNTDPSEPYVPFIEARYRPWWAYQTSRRGSRFVAARRLVGRTLIRAGRAMATEHRAHALG